MERERVMVPVEGMFDIHEFRAPCFRLGAASAGAVVGALGEF